MERKSELTKALLGEKFKELVAKKGFEKLTIKMITDAAGVIRPTFYNYFQDKYEVMEWLLWEDVFKEVSELMEQERGMESLKLLFRKFEEDKTYYEKVFEVTGQNSFEEMLYGQIFNMEEILVKHHPLKHLSNMPHVDEKGISGISCNIIGEWTEILAYPGKQKYFGGRCNGILSVYDVTFNPGSVGH